MRRNRAGYFGAHYRQSINPLTRLDGPFNPKSHRDHAGFPMNRSGTVRPRISAGAHCCRPAVASIGNVAGVQGLAMLRDDSGNGGGRPKAPRNVLGVQLEDCSMKPLTGFFRDGCCNTSREDIGGHTVCAIMTAEFLEFSKSCGNDLSTPMPEFGFPGLRPGDRWCLCASRWQQALEAGQAPA